MASKLDRPNKHSSLKLWLFYLVVQTNRLLDTDWLSPLMCIDIEMLFSIIRVVRMWCGILVSAAGFINNGGMLGGRDPN